MSKDKKPKFVYSSVNLDDESHRLLIQYFNKSIPQSWKKIAHHMTITLGYLPDDMKSDIGKEISLKVISIGKSDKAIACGVEGYKSFNEKPHITLAVNESIGGKPKDSNNIDIWYPLAKPFYVSGIVKENIYY